jgi:uncharacterized protein YidB (DUF937 family)
MALIDVLGGRRGRTGGSGMSPVQMAVLGLLAYRTLKSRGRLAGAGSTAGGLGGLLAGGALSGGLKDLMDRFRQTGQEQKAQSWVSTGANQSIAPNELEQVLGEERINWLVEETGMARDQLLAKLSGELPAAVDELTPDGRLPTDDEVTQRLNLPH